MDGLGGSLQGVRTNGSCSGLLTWHVDDWSELPLYGWDGRKNVEGCVVYVQPGMFCMDCIPLQSGMYCMTRIPSVVVIH